MVNWKESHSKSSKNTLNNLMRERRTLPYMGQKKRGCGTMKTSSLFMKTYSKITTKGHIT